MLRAIVFDFDGVLANSEPLHLQAFREVVADDGIAVTDAEYYQRYLGFDDVGMFAALAKDRGRVWDTARIRELMARKAARLEALERDRSVLFPGAAAVVRAAAAQVPIAIASGALGVEIRRVLDREQLTSCFSAIVSAEDTASSKPSPDPYLRAVARLSSVTAVSPRECVAIEDSLWGLESAQRAGLKTVAVAQSYPAATLSSADLVLDSIADLDVSRLRILLTD